MTDHEIYCFSHRRFEPGIVCMTLEEKIAYWHRLHFEERYRTPANVILPETVVEMMRSAGKPTKPLPFPSGRLWSEVAN